MATEEQEYQDEVEFRLGRPVMREELWKFREAGVSAEQAAQIIRKTGEEKKEIQKKKLKKVM
jgi:hypothetical protein